MFYFLDVASVCLHQLFLYSLPQVITVITSPVSNQDPSHLYKQMTNLGFEMILSLSNFLSRCLRFIDLIFHDENGESVGSE